MEDRIKILHGMLKPNGNFVLHVDAKAVHYLKVVCDGIFGRENFRNEIIWAYSSPSVAKRWFPKKHDTLLWYGLKDYTFNEQRVQYSSNLKVGGKTSWAGKDVDVETCKDKGKLLEDWWTDIPALCRNEKEKTGYATQKPIKLLERVVSSFSNEGDTIYDPFMGSGTLLEVGLSLKRNVIGSDISKSSIETVTARLQNKATITF